MCIGTNNIIGDSLGPTIGDLLIMEHNIDAYVYGHTARPVNGKNYFDYIRHINTHHKHNLVIAVDACVGNATEVGKIKCSLNGITAGGALDKGYERIGDIGILGIVAAAQQDNLATLSKVDARFINQLAIKIARIISKLILNINNIVLLNQQVI